MSYLDKKLSSLKITEIWSKLFRKNKFLTSNISSLKNNNFKIFIYLFFIQNSKSILTTIILFIKRKIFLKNLLNHKNQELNIKDIKKRVAEITSVLKIKNNLNISKLGKDIILISPKKNT